MKTKMIIPFAFAILLSGILSSCSKDENPYTIEDQPVTGNMAYVVTSLVPLDFDSVTHQPIRVSITMTGTGSLSNMGQINMVSSFDFNLVTGQGTNFVTTYSGTTGSDSYNAQGSSQRQQDGSISVTESFNNGKGKFEKISGGGKTSVSLLPDGSGGTGTVSWTVTY